MADSGRLLWLKGVRKRFGGSLALEDVDFDLRPGEVHVLFGENGAGKSTLINVITGNVSPDAGDYRLAGAEAPRMTPRLARDLGIASVFQEFSLVPDLSVAENLFLGREPNRATFVNSRRMRDAAAQFMTQLRFDVAVDAIVNRLSRAERQMVEIAKALMDATARIFIFDEPTASLTDADAEKLFAIIGGPQGAWGGRRLCVPPDAGNPSACRQDHRLAGRPPRRHRFGRRRHGRSARRTDGREADRRPLSDHPSSPR